MQLAVGLLSAGRQTQKSRATPLGIARHGSTVRLAPISTTSIEGTDPGLILSRVALRCSWAYAADQL